MPHLLGLVIGGTSVGGVNCTLLHRGMLGLHRGMLGEERFDELDCAHIGAGTIVLGGITVGDDATIGAGSVVLTGVSPGAK